jgi:Protein of unknown function (DUF2934)
LAELYQKRFSLPNDPRFSQQLTPLRGWLVASWSNFICSESIEAFPVSIRHMQKIEHIFKKISPNRWRAVFMRCKITQAVERRILTMPKTRESSSPTVRKPRKTAKSLPTHEEIALRAYMIYLERNGAPGNPLEDWTRAERELIAGNAKPRRKAAPKPVAAKSVAA